MPPRSLALGLAIGILMVDSIIELSLISSMVNWLHRRTGKGYEINYQGTTFLLQGEPLGLIVNQGHTSNGAAGTAFILIGVGGFLALWLRDRTAPSKSGLGRFGPFWYKFWLVMTVPSVLLTLAALIYTFFITNNHTGQTIDISLAAALHNHPHPTCVAYPADQWTPENWFTAVLKLPLASSSDRSDIELRLRVMRGWRWNLIPLLIIGLTVSTLAYADFFQRRRLSKCLKEAG